MPWRSETGIRSAVKGIERQETEGKAAKTLPLTYVVVRTLLQSHAILHLSYIERSDLKSILLFAVGLDVIVGAFLRCYLLFLSDIEAIQINLD